MSEKMKVDRKDDVLLLAVGLSKRLKGQAKLQKILFLLQKKTEIFERERLDFFEFDEKGLGPFSDEIEDTRQMFETLGYIEKIGIFENINEQYELDNAIPIQHNMKPGIYQLTEKGKEKTEEMIQSLDKKSLKELKTTVKGYARHPLSRILMDIYDEEYKESRPTLREQIKNLFSFFIYLEAEK